MVRNFVLDLEGQMQLLPLSHASSLTFCVLLNLLLPLFPLSRTRIGIAPCCSSQSSRINQLKRENYVAVAEKVGCVRAPWGSRACVLWEWI